MVTEEQLDKFIAIYKEVVGKDIGRAEALQQAIALLTMLKAVYKPISLEDIELLRKRDAELGIKKDYSKFYEQYYKSKSSTS